MILADDEKRINTLNAKLADCKKQTEYGKAALAIEQRQRGITEQQLAVLQDQLVTAQTRTALDAAFMDADDEYIKELNDELDTERRINNAALKPTQIQAEDTGDLKRARARVRDAKAEAEDTRDALACMAEEGEALKRKLSETLAHGANLAYANGALKRDISILQDSAETQAMFMQQVDEACKAAEAKVVEQRKEIERLQTDDYICSHAKICDSSDGCAHATEHKRADWCLLECMIADSECVKVINTCKECAGLKEEIINRDAVILEYERRAEDREEIIKALAKEVNAVRESMNRRKEVSKQRDRIIQSIEFDTPEMHQGYQPRAHCVGKRMEINAPTIGKFPIMVLGKLRAKKSNPCEFFDICPLSQSTSYTCTNQLAERNAYCGRYVELEAEHGRT